jgi:hypothetical protein
MAALQSPFECGRYRVGKLFDRAGTTDDYYSRSHRDPLTLSRREAPQLLPVSGSTGPPIARQVVYFRVDALQARLFNR